MTDTRKVQLGAEFDATGVRHGTEQAKEAVRDMARDVARQGEVAGKGLDNIGKGGESAGKKVEQATRSIIASIERTTAAMQAGARGSADYYEKLAQQRGVSGDALKPYLEQLRQAEAAQRAATGSLNNMGMSAKATAAALRGVPAQFTDIATSIAGGQKPLTVFLQQGGQLKDMFGGAGPAAKALGGYVLGLINPFTLAAAAAAALTYAYNGGANEALAFQKTMILTGHAAGVTAGQLSDMARAVNAGGAGTQGRAAEIIDQMAASARIGAENLQRFTAAALQLERVGGPAAEETAKAFADLGKEPLAASLKLNESTNFLTASVYRQIKALEDQGRTVDAARLAQQSYADAIEQRGPQLLASLGLIERAWLGIKDATKGAYDAALNVGRSTTSSQLVDGLRKEISQIEETAGKNSFEASRLPALRAKLAALQQGLKFEEQSAFLSGQAAASVKDQVKWLQEGDKYLKPQVTMKREIARAELEGRRLVVAGLLTEKELTERIAAIREKYAEKGAKAKPLVNPLDTEALRAYAKGLDEFGKIANDAAGKADGLGKTQIKLREIQADPVWATYSRQQREQTIYAASLAQAEETRAAATLLSAKAAEEAGKAYAKWIGEIKRSADLAQQQVDQLELEAQASALVVDGYRSLAQAIHVVEIVRLRDRQAAMLGNDEAVAEIEREIAARQRLIGLIGAKEARKASEDAAKKAAEDWKKAAEKIEDAITDALMHGFGSGKGIAQNLRDTIVNMFKTMVLRPIVQAAVQPLAGQLASTVGSVFGLGGTGGGGSLLSAGSNAYQLATGAGLFGSSAAYGAAIGTTSIGAGSQAAMLAAQTGVFGAEGAALTAAAAGNAGASALFSTIGAAAPYLAAVLAVVAIAKSLDNSGTLHTGAASAFSSGGGLQTGKDLAGLGFGNLAAHSGQTETLTTGLAKGIVGLLDSTATAFGKQAGYAAAAGFADDSSSDGSWGALLISRMGKTLTDWGATRQSRWAPREFADGEAGLQQYLAAVSADVRTALDDIGLPSWAQGMLDNLGSAPSIEQLSATVAQINATVAALGNLGSALPQLANLSSDAVTALLTAFGGIENLTKSASSYYQAFYSQVERNAVLAKTVDSTLAGLGLSRPDSLAAYRKLVESQDLTTESGRTAYAALLNLSGAFAELANGAAAATDSIKAEIARLRGTSTDKSQAALLASFASTTAQARAGDEKALQALPDISRSLEAAAMATAGSALDIARMRAWLARSLGETIGVVPGYASGGNFSGGLRIVGEQGAELEATGPARIFNAADTARMLSGGRDATEARLAELVEQMASLNEAMRATAIHTSKSARLLERVMPDGDAIATRTAAA